MKKIYVYIFLILSTSFYVSTLQAEQAEAIDYTSDLNHHKIQKVLLVVAMDTEALPIINALNLKKSPHSFSDLPMQGYVGKYSNLDIFLIINGQDPMYKVQNIGTQAATLTTYLGIEYFHPDLVISIGTAGGIPENGAKIGDIYVSRKIYFYDRRIPPPGYYEYGFGGYKSADFSDITDKMNIKKGIVCSGDSFAEDSTDKEMILKKNCSVIEMEAAGVAWVSMLTKTPMFAMKGITDIVGSKTGFVDFKKNFPTVTNKLCEKIKVFFGKLSKLEM